MIDLKEDANYVTWLHEQYQDAEAFTDEDTVAAERETAINYYLRRPMGDERPGRSQVISGDVYKVVEGISTAIADIFCSTADSVAFMPRSEDDEQKAKERTEAVMYTFWTTCSGYLPMLESIKSGVQQKHGYLTWYWSPEKRLTRERYRGLTQEALELLNDNQDIKEVKITGQAMTPDGPIFDVEVDLVKDMGRPVVESIAPEYVKVSPLAKTCDTQKAPALFVETFKSEMEAIKCGYTPEQIESMDFGGDQWNESVVRNRDRASPNDGQAKIVTAYVEVDRDGDGVVELRKTVFSGDAIISDDVVDEINLAGWTPNIQPHEYHGRSPADDAVQVQKLNTTLWRQALDSLYHSTNPMWRVDKDASRVNIEDFYNPQIGRPLRADPGSAEPINLPYVGHQVFPMLEYSTADSENLTGWTRYSQGTDAASLNKTLGGMRMITNMSQQRIRMMARNYGEMCFARCLKGISKLLSQHGVKALQLRISGRYTQVDPREWSEEFDMSVNVGLGTIDREQQMQQIGMVSQAQAAAVQGGGLGKILTLDNLYNVQRKIADLAGIKDPTFAWTDPKTVPPPQGPPPPPPEIVKEQMKLQADAQKFQAQAQVDREREERERQDADMDRQTNMTLQIELERVKQAGETDRLLKLEALKMQQAQIAAAPHEQTNQSMTEVMGMLAQGMQSMQVIAQAVMESAAAMQQAAAAMSAPKEAMAVVNGKTYRMTSQPVQ